MRLRSQFLSKVFLATLIAMQPTGFSYAQNHGDQHHVLDSTVFKAQVQKMISLVDSSSNTILDEIVKFANSMAGYNTQKNVKGLSFSLKYIENSQNSIDGYEVGVSPDGNSVNVTVLVNKLAKTNPFLMLESLIQIGKMYNLGNIAYYDYEAKSEWIHSNHPHHAPQYSYTFKDVSFSLEASLGVPSLFHHHAEAIHSTDLKVVSEAAKALSPVEMVELIANAKAGSVFAQRRLAEMDSSNFFLLKRSLKTFKPLLKMSEQQRKEALLEYAKTKKINIAGTGSFEASLQQFIDAFDKAQKSTLDTLNIKAKQVYRQQQQEYKEGASVRKLLSEGPALNEMIKANDRAGVASAMEKMLPWSLMEPTEKVFWQDFIDAIRNPKYENAEVLFRGIDANEKFQAVTDSSGNIIGGGMLSKRLTSGSGSHFLKLQGLPETFETFGTYGGQSSLRVSPLNQPHTLSTMMLNHAMNPVGSPFISFTYSLSVARGFALGSAKESADEKEFKKNYEAALKGPISGGLATVVIDSRRVLVNSISPFKDEVEVLASMFVFPDETVYFEKGVMINTKVGEEYKYIERSTIDEYYARARQAVLEKRGIQLPPTHQEMAARGANSFKRGVVMVNKIFDRAGLGGATRCESLF